MKLVTVSEYMQAAESLVTDYAIDTPFIYLTTETYEAYNAFNKEFLKDKYANWTLLNYRHSLAGTGHVSGYQERDPSLFVNRNNVTTTPGENVVNRLQLGRGGKKHQQALTDLLDEMEDKSESNRKLFLNVEKNKEAKTGNAHKKLQHSGIKNSHGNDRNGKYGKAKGKSKVKKSGGYKITPAVKAISPMNLAKKGAQTLGRHSLISLLIAMEARHYIITTGSNWSRLIDELRTNVLNAKCEIEKSAIDSRIGDSYCTTVMDLMKGDSPDW